MRYLENLRWYRRASKFQLYTVAGEVLPRLCVIDSFNYWTGRVRLRAVRASVDAPPLRQVHAWVIAPVGFRDNLASESTVVL